MYFLNLFLRFDLRFGFRLCTVLLLDMVKQSIFIYTLAFPLFSFKHSLCFLVFPDNPPIKRHLIKPFILHQILVTLGDIGWLGWWLLKAFWNLKTQE